MPVKAMFQKNDTIAERVGKDGIGRHAIVTATGVMSNNQVMLHLRYADGTTHGSADQRNYVLVSRPIALEGLDSTAAERSVSTAPAIENVQAIAANVLSDLARNVAQRNRIDREIALGVARARRAPFNASWAEIGAALGTSGQAAGQKYGSNR
jgi:hypothetical protein